MSRKQVAARTIPPKGIRFSEGLFLRSLEASLLSSLKHDDALVLNISMGLRPGAIDRSHRIFNVFRRLYDKGKILVVAAGNFGPLPGTMSPLAVCPWVISVGASQSDGTVSEFSSRGLPGSDFDRPTVVAHGENVLIPATRLGIENAEDTDIAVSGTSFSTATVSSLLNFLFNQLINAGCKFPENETTPQFAKWMLSEMAVPPKDHYEHESGWGLVSHEIANQYALLTLFPKLFGPGIYVSSRSNDERATETRAFHVESYEHE